MRLQICLLTLILTLRHFALVAEPAFMLRFEGVNLDYPGGEQWAEIECPDGTHDWCYAIYQGGGSWKVPLRAGAAGSYRILHVERRAGGKISAVAIAKESPLVIEVKASQGFADPGPVTKPLVEAGEFTTFFEAIEPWCVNDHSFVQGPDRSWHLFGITHPKPLVWDQDPGRQLCHVTAATLRQTPWQSQDPAVKRDWERHREFLLWAPHVLRYADLYYMFVCVGDPGDHARYRIHLLTSTDLNAWTRSPDNPLVMDGFDARDPFVTRFGEEWVLYYTANSTPQGGNHQVVCVTSRDLKHWSNRRVVFTHPRAGSFGGPTESPFIVQRGRNFYLFVCDNEWTDVYVSNDPFHWEFAQRNTRLLTRAAEIVRDTDGRWFISHAGWMSGPLRLAPLRWMDALDAEPTNIPPAEK